MLVLYVAFGLVVLVVLWLVATYNGLVRARNMADEAWSGVDVQLKRRHDLVPNLVETVKGYAAHERETLEATTAARSAAISAGDGGGRAAAESGLSAALGNIRALAEQYPELQAAENFQRLQAQLAEIEDEIQAARRIYNSNAQRYNTSIQVFPNSIVAGAASFTSRAYFEIELAQERAVPVITFT